MILHAHIHTHSYLSNFSFSLFFLRSSRDVNQKTIRLKSFYDVAFKIITLPCVWYGRYFINSQDYKYFIENLSNLTTITSFFFFRFNRRRKDTKLFLVAFYECNDDYELENLEHDRLYCSREQWVGDAPKCMRIHDEGEEEGTEEEEEEGKFDRSIIC